MIYQFKIYLKSLKQTTMRLITLIILACLLLGTELTACPLCTNTSICGTYDIGILGTAQGRVWVICDCDTPVKVIVKKGNVVIDSKTLTKHGEKWELNEDISSGTYTIEAHHDNDDKPDQVIKNVRIPD